MTELWELLFFYISKSHFKILPLPSPQSNTLFFSQMSQAVSRPPLMEMDTPSIVSPPDGPPDVDKQVNISWLLEAQLRGHNSQVTSD